MSKPFASVITDLFYLTGIKTGQYKSKNPNASIFYSAGCKAIKEEKDSDVTRGKQWVTSQRSVFILSDKEIKCGKFIVPVERIQSAVYFIANSSFNKVLVLKISTKDNEFYQFGLNYDKKWMDQKIFPYKVEEGKIKSSPGSILYRLFSMGIILYFLLKYFKLI